MATTTLQSTSGEIFDASSLFTCLSCSIAFQSADDQRAHYRSDHHRYNMKRRVASLPPVSAAVFNQKVLERRAETSVMSSAKGAVCTICNKTYTTENAYRSHINSKRHKELEAKHNVTLKAQMDAPSEEVATSKEEIPPVVESKKPEISGTKEEDVEMTIDQKIAQARTRLSTSDCLFCSTHSESLAANLEHMSIVHGFFVPDAEYLVDLAGLITYLGEKIAVGNVCTFCYGRKRRNANTKAKVVKDDEDAEADVGREFRSLEATRRHMIDKAHCKIAYDTEDARLEISDYYDFSSSYPAARKRSKKTKANEEWEDMEVSDASGAEEVVEDSESDKEESDDEDPETGIRFGDTPYELVLPSGARIGHRSLRHYYKQNYRIPARSEEPAEEDPKSGKALVRHLLSQKNSALVPRKGGFGAFGEGGEVVKARNPGEAREAGRHVKEYRDVKRREDFKTKVGFIANNQKHYRDPLLQ